MLLTLRLSSPEHLTTVRHTLCCGNLYFWFSSAIFHSHRLALVTANTSLNFCVQVLPFCWLIILPEGVLVILSFCTEILRLKYFRCTEEICLKDFGNFHCTGLKPLFYIVCMVSGVSPSLAGTEKTENHVATCPLWLTALLPSMTQKVGCFLKCHMVKANPIYLLPEPWSCNQKGPGSKAWGAPIKARAVLNISKAWQMSRKTSTNGSRLSPSCLSPPACIMTGVEHLCSAAKDKARCLNGPKHVHSRRFWVPTSLGGSTWVAALED